MGRKRPEYSEDIFAETRMSFGDHLEELRHRMWNAVKALLFCLVIGFFLDGVGSTFGWKNFGVGVPALEIIKGPVEEQMNAFYDERAWKAKEALMPPANTSEEKKKREEEKKQYLKNSLAIRDDDSVKLNQGQPIRLELKKDDLQKAVQDQGDSDYVAVNAKIPPIDLVLLMRIAQERVGKRNQLTALSVQEMFIVYFKVTLLCGFILASPIIFYQFWAFVGAGLYPHEKRYVHIYLPFSLGLFLAGILLCFLFVLPGAVRALLAFNEWLGVDPDLRLSEWLGLALILPLVFGISFQTPLVMLFFNRLGMFSWEDYLSKWRYAVMVLAVFAAVITPTPDAITMMYLFVPMFGLYMFGILLCKWMPGPERRVDEESVRDEEVAV